MGYKRILADFSPRDLKNFLNLQHSYINLRTRKKRRGEQKSGSFEILPCTRSSQLPGKEGYPQLIVEEINTDKLDHLFKITYKDTSMSQLRC